MNTPNPELQLASEFVQYTNCNIFLTGKAGTGKTTFLHDVKKQTYKRLIVTAPTGVAAINAGGVTLHSFFQMPFGPFVPGSESYNSNQHRFSKIKKNIIKSLDLLVIDEISMVRADLLDCVDSVLRRHRRNNRPFGGVQLLMIGDLHQLSPVIKDSEWRILQKHYDSPYFFSSTALRQTELIPIELKHIYRQSDGTFIELLNRVRDNRMDPATLEKLNSRYIRDFSPHEKEGYITLCTHNRNADSINNSKLKTLEEKSQLYQAELEGEFPEHTYPTAATLELKVGAQVMFMRNDSSPEKRYFNGKIGKITHMSAKGISVSCPEDLEEIDVEQATWDNIEYTVDPETAEISEKIIGTFAQYPLKLAWAITIHKSQGLTFDKAIIDAQAAFAHGQVYVALSRCRTFEGMVLSSTLVPSAVKTDSTVNRYVEEAQLNEPTQEKLEAATIQYQQQLLFECFSFEKLRSLVGRLVWQINRNSGLVQVSGVGDIGELHRKTTEEVYNIGENFRRQLQGLFSDGVKPQSDNVVLERLAKASAYFQEKISTVLSADIENIQIETDNKEIRKKINNTIKQLLEEIPVKLAGVKSCQNDFSPSQYLRAVSVAGLNTSQPKKKTQTATYSEEDVGHPILFQSLKDWRSRKAAEEEVAHFLVLHQKTLIQIAIHLPDTLAALQKIKGIGKKLAERYGDDLVELVSGYRKEHNIKEVILPLLKPSLEIVEVKEKAKEKAKEKIDTKKVSLELFNKGLTIDQISSERGLTRATIEKHMASLIESGELEISEFLEDDRRKTIEEIVSGMLDKPLKEMKIALGDGYAYGEIQLVRAHLISLEKE